MAIFHLHSQYIGRSGGRSAVAASAYRSASKLVEEIVCQKTGVVTEIVHDYRYKKGVIFSEVIVPDKCALWMRDRESLWNCIQNKFDTRCNSIFAGEKDIALPVELTEEQNVALVKDFIDKAFTEDGIIADVNIHYDNIDNPHFHVMTSTREIVFDMTLGQEGEYTFGNKLRYLDHKEYLVNLRRTWAECLNTHLKLNGIDKQVSHLSFKALGIDLVPGIKEGKGRRILGSDRTELNNNITKLNLRRIQKKPELIIDVLRKDRPVFTKDDISNALINCIWEEDHHSITTLGIGAGFEEKNELEQQTVPVSADLPGEGVDNIIPAPSYDEAEKIKKYISSLSKVLASKKLVSLETKDLEGRSLYTSKARYELEKDLINIMHKFKHGNSCELLSDKPGKKLHIKKNHSLKIRLEDIENANEEGLIKRCLGSFRGTKDIPLSDKQKGVVLEIVNGTNISVVEGLPGSGKTTVMKEVAKLYKKAGYKVIGTAVSAGAATELGRKADIESLTTTKLRYDLELMRRMIAGAKDFDINLRIDYYKDYFEGVSTTNIKKSLFSKKTVLIIDEASLVDLTELHFILREAIMVGAKVILLGDRAQLSSCGISGGLEKSADIFGIVRLDEVRRQKNPAHRRATELLANYEVSKAIELYKKEDVFSIGDTQEEARSQLVRDYVMRYKDLIKEDGVLKKSLVALSYTNEEVTKLNHGIRSRLKDGGVVYGESVLFAGSGGRAIELAKGDRVVFDRNSHDLGVTNGDVGVVTGFGISEDKKRKTIKVRLDSEACYLGIRVPTNIEVDNADYKSLSYGFAITIAKAQGRTWNLVLALMDPHTGYNAFNVMCTRHEEFLKIYAGEKESMDVLYRRVDKNTVRAREEWEIYASEGPEDESSAAKEERHRNILYAAISAIAYARDGRSLVEDYKWDDKQDIKKVVSDYLELRTEALKMNNFIFEWLKIERLKEKVGKSEIAKEKEAEFYQLQSNRKISEEAEWEGLQFFHHPLYPDLQELKNDRDKKASILYRDYNSYSKIITQANINFVTVEKHAGESIFEFKIKKNLPDSKIFGDEDGTEKIKRILSLCKEIRECELSSPHMALTPEDSNTGLIMDEIYNETGILHKSYGEKRLEITELNIKLQQINKEQSSCKVTIEEASEYMQESIDSFLSKTYKDDPSKIIAKWEEIKEKEATQNTKLEAESIIEEGVETKGIYNALKKIRKNPQILGGLKGIGVGSFFALNGKRFRATVNMYNSVHAFKKYEECKSIIQRFQAQSEELSKAQSDIIKSIEILKNGLVGSELEELLSEINKVFSHSESNHERITNGACWAKDTINIEKVDLYRALLSPEDPEFADNESYYIADVEDGRIAYKKDNLITKEDYKSNAYVQREPRLSFEYVKSCLGPNEYEELFMKYAPIITSKKEIKKDNGFIKCGSLSMNLNHGGWVRYSSGATGNIFGMVSEALGVSTYDSLLCVAGDLRISPIANVTSQSKERTVSKPTATIAPSGPKDEWIPYSNIPENAPAFDIRQHVKKMLYKNKVAAVYEYKDSEGKTRGYTVRFISKEDGKKSVLPVAYCYNPLKEENSWELKGFDDGRGGKPIYGLEKLKKFPYKPVLVVEGEKAADKAQELFPEYVVISWLGGTSNAEKVNWRLAEGRDIVIWPDNDEVGRVAALKIRDRINNITGGIGKAGIINPDRLYFGGNIHEEILPRKWDLADSLPEGVRLEDLKEVLSNSIKDSKILSQTSSRPELSEIEEQILWRQRSVGDHLLFDDIQSILNREREGLKIFVTEEAKALLKQALARRRIESSHEFLGFTHSFYSETLANVALNERLVPSIHKEPETDIESGITPSREDAAHAVEAGRDKSDITLSLLHEIANKYSQKISSYSGHTICKSYIKSLEELSSDKAELMVILTRDVIFLHTMQLENSTRINDKKTKYNVLISEVHKEKVAKDIYKIISQYKAFTRNKQSTHRLENSDKVSIAEEVYSKLHSSKWWKSLAETKLEIGSGENVLEEVKASSTIGAAKSTVEGIDKSRATELTAPASGFKKNNKQEKSRVHKLIEDEYAEIFKEIKEFAPKYDTCKLKEHLASIREDLREDAVRKEWIGVFKANIDTKLDGFKTSKAKAKGAVELVGIMEKEGIYCARIEDKYHRAVQALYEEENDVRLTKAAMHYEEKDKDGNSIFAKDLKEDALNIEKFGINPPQKEWDEIRKSQDHGYIAGRLLKYCKGYASHEAHKNIELLNEEGYCKVEGRKFTNVYDFLKHEVENGSMSRYFQGTQHQKTLLKLEEDRHAKHDDLQHMEQYKAPVKQVQRNKGIDMDM